MADKQLDSISDEKLFSKYQNSGDTSAFETLYYRYSKKILAYCIRASYDRESANDIFQKVWTAIIEKKSSFKGGSFIAWAMIITRNFCLMEKRSSKFNIEINENIEKYEPEEFTDDIKKYLRQEIELLPADYKEIIAYRYFDEFSYNEIAEILDLSVANVKVRLFRAKKLLNDRLSFLKKDIR